MPDRVLPLLEDTLGINGDTKRHINFSVLLNWQTLDQLADAGHPEAIPVVDASRIILLRREGKEPNSDGTEFLN